MTNKNIKNNNKRYIINQFIDYMQDNYPLIIINNYSTLRAYLNAYLPYENRKKDKKNKV